MHPDRIFWIRTLVKLSVNLRGLVTIALQSVFLSKLLFEPTQLLNHTGHTQPCLPAEATLRGAFALKVSFIKTRGQSCRRGCGDCWLRSKTGELLTLRGDTDESQTSKDSALHALP